MFNNTPALIIYFCLVSVNKKHYFSVRQYVVSKQKNLLFIQILMMLRTKHKKVDGVKKRCTLMTWLPYKNSV